MAEEIQEAVQIIRMAYDGIDIVMKIGGGALEQAKKVLDFLLSVLEHEKTMGKTDMKKLLLKGGDLQVFQFDAKDMGKVRRMAKKYGILYSVVPDMSGKRGKREIIFHTEAVPRVNMMVLKLKSGRIVTVDEHLKSAEGKEAGRACSSFLNKQEGRGFPGGTDGKQPDKGLVEKAGLYAAERPWFHVEGLKENLGISSVQAEKLLDILEKTDVVRQQGDGYYKAVMDREDFLARIRSSGELAGRMQQAAAVPDQDRLDITVSGKLVVEEKGQEVRMRIPGTWGENARYLWIDRKNITDIHSGKTVLTFLERDKEYRLYDAGGRAVSVMRGNDLYESHYDRVSAEVRKRHAEAGLKTADGKKAPAPGKGVSSRKRR